MKPVLHLQVFLYLIQGTNDAERNQYEMNARNQVTMWGPSGQVRKINHWYSRPCFERPLNFSTQIGRKGRWPYKRGENKHQI